MHSILVLPLFLLRLFDLNRIQILVSVLRLCKELVMSDCGKTSCMYTTIVRKS
jgi:hypothetical protein